MDNDDLMNICLETILDHVFYSVALEIYGVTMDSLGLCKTIANNEPFDFVSLYLRLKEGELVCIGDFGSKYLDRLHEISNTLSLKYELPIFCYHDKALAK